MKSLSIVLPCYNEADNINKIFERFREVLKGREDVEVLLVNNGSTDDTSFVIQQHLEKPENNFAKVIDVTVNKGYGFGIMSGVYAASGEYISWTHADMQTDPADVLTALELIQQYPKDAKVIVKGRRISRNILDTFFTFGMSVISSVALSAKLYDINAQPKLFHKSFLKKLENTPDDFSLDLYLLYMARRLSYDIKEVKVNFAQRLHGEAKGGGTLKGKFKLIKRTWSYIFKLKKELKVKN